MKSYLPKVFVLFFATFLFLSSASGVLAANFSMARIRYDRMKASTPTSLQVTLVPATALTENKLLLVFGSAIVGTGQSVTVTNLPVGTSALPGTLTAVGAGTSIMVSGVTELTVGTTYAFNIALAGTGIGVSTPAASTTTDTVTTLTAASSVIDSSRVQARYVTEDQVVITANVPPTFNFVFSGNTDSFTTDLSSGSVVTTYGIGLTVSTNAAKGWTGWIKSTAALTSITTGENIGTTGSVDGATSTCVVGTDCYILDVGVSSGTGSGTLTADAEYAGNGTTSGGTFSTIFQPFASRNGKTGGDMITLKAHTSMLATKAAGSDYTDTWTIIGAGNF